MVQGLRAKRLIQKDECFDNKVKNNIGDLVKEALFGYLNTWPKSLDGSIALMTLTDHFTRNIFRGTPR